MRDPESMATFPIPLFDLTERLKHWKNILQSNVDDLFPIFFFKLEEESRVLNNFHVVKVEVPGLQDRHYFLLYDFHVVA